MAVALNLLSCAGASGAAGSLSLEQATQAALADAARRTGAAVSALQVASAEAVTWADGSLGCPEPDRMYTQALVPGYRIRILHGTVSLDYHGSTRTAPSWCAPGRASPPVAGRARM